MCLKTGQGGNKVVHWRGWPSIEKAMSVKNIFLEVVTSEWSKYSQILDQNKTKDKCWLIQKILAQGYCLLS
jgi:hypothetical protein